MDSLRNLKKTQLRRRSWCLIGCTVGFNRLGINTIVFIRRSGNEPKSPTSWHFEEKLSKNKGENEISLGTTWSENQTLSWLRSLTEHENTQHSFTSFVKSLADWRKFSLVTRPFWQKQTRLIPNRLRAKLELHEREQIQWNKLRIHCYSHSTAAVWLHFELTLVKQRQWWQRWGERWLQKTTDSVWTSSLLPLSTKIK